MFAEERVRLVRFGDIYLFYDAEDHAFEHVMLDPAARVVTLGDIDRDRPAPRIDAEQTYASRGVWPLHLGALHLHRLGREFEYIDVGANVGLTVFTTALFFERLGWRTPVLGFEPHPHVFGLFRRGLEANGLAASVEAFELACSDRAGAADFYMTPAQTPASSLLPEAVNREFVIRNEATRVETARLDTVLAQRPVRDLVLKIDAEGADFKVLDGMGDMLRDRLCLGQIEFFPMILDAYSTPYEYLLRLAEDFELYDLTEGDQVVAPISTTPEDLHAYVDGVRARRPFGAGDILFVPRRLPELGRFRERLLAR